MSSDHTAEMLANPGLRPSSKHSSSEDTANMPTVWTGDIHESCSTHILRSYFRNFISINLAYKSSQWYFSWLLSQKYEFQDGGSNTATIKMVQTKSFKVRKCYMTKRLPSALLGFVQENFELTMGDQMWLPLKYNAIFMLHEFLMVLS